MPQVPEYQELLDAGVHFGHLKRKWNPAMSQYIFMERKGIHIIDLNRTREAMEKTGKALTAMAKSGRKIMFVATKKQASEIVAQAAREVEMPYVTDRWLGGMMTNFATIRKSIKKMQSTDRMLQDGTLSNVTKKERLMMTRERDKLEKTLGGIANLNRLPAALFIVDIHHEHIAVDEAHKLGLRTFGIVDTNSDPRQVDFAIPGNDDAAKSIQILVDFAKNCIKEGLEQRRKAKEEKAATEQA